MRVPLSLALVALLAACKSAVPLPEKAVALNTAGIAALAQGDLETADARFSLALEYSPEFVDALVNLGLTELQRGNFERARQLFTRARRLNPDIAQPHHALGVLAERERRPDRASAHYYEALRVDPGFSPARANLGRLLFADGALEEALVQFKRLVEVAPDEVSGHSGLCETLLRLGRASEADAVLEATDRLGDAPELELLRARAALRRGDVEQAVALLSPLSRRRDELGVAALGFLATAELSRGRPRHAVGAAQRALELDPEASVAVYVLALSLAELGAPDARPWLERAARARPDDPVLSRWLSAK